MTTTPEVREAYQLTGDGLVFASTTEHRGREFDEWLARERRVATHDMPADLYNAVTAALLDSGKLFLAESVRSFYGASTRRALGLPEHGAGGQPVPMNIVDMDAIEAHYAEMIGEAIHRGES